MCLQKRHPARHLSLLGKSLQAYEALLHILGSKDPEMLSIRACEAEAHPTVRVLLARVANESECEGSLGGQGCGMMEPAAPAFRRVLWKSTRPPRSGRKLFLDSINQST